MESLEKVGFFLIGYGCTTCIGNSGPLNDDDRRGHPQRRPGRQRRAQRQPQLRGARAPERARQLPGLAAAGRGLRARRHHGHRPLQRADRHGQRRQAGLPQGHLAHAEGGQRHHPERRCRARCSRALRRRVQGPRAVAEPSTCPRATPSSGTTKSTYVRKAPFFEGLTKDEPKSRAGHRRRARAGQGRRLHHDRSHLARRQHRQGQPRGASTCRRTASPRATSTSTARVAATTR